jgi:hypothetical protein
MSDEFQDQVVDRVTVIESRWRDRFTQRVQEKVNKLKTAIKEAERSFNAKTGDEDER